MKHFFAYVRVSTGRQANEGVSLPEQRFQLERYAAQKGFRIVRWFEEHRSAMKPGRPVFNAMLHELDRERPDGILVHKVDRTARNSRDWSDLSTLADRGFQVHITDSDLDLSTREGRMVADMLAVMAADYSRNLRNEAKKGMYGRLRQGLTPWKSPLGYTEGRKGQPKQIDPVRGPLIRRLFELYATSRFSLRTLTHEAVVLGLRSRTGRRLRLKQIHDILRNPFYVGIVRLNKTGESFDGVHTPLVPLSVFQRVQHVLAGRSPRKATVHEFTFRRLLACHNCDHTLIGELQKGRVYYRCHTRDCPTTTVREDVVEQGLFTALAPLTALSLFRAELAAEAKAMQAQEASFRTQRTTALTLQFTQVQERLSRLTDAYLDGIVDATTVEHKKAALLLERRDLQEQMSGATADSTERIDDFLELAQNAILLYQHALPNDRRELLELLTSNRTVRGRTPVFSLAFPFEEMARAAEQHFGSPLRDTARTEEAEMPEQQFHPLSESKSIARSSAKAVVSAIRQMVPPDHRFATRVHQLLHPVTETKRRRAA